MNKEILRLAIPNIISNVSVPLLSTVDTALMGHVSASHLGAVGLASMIFNFIYWNFGFLRMGTTGMVAQAFGEKSKQKWSSLLYRGMSLAVVLALIIFIMQNELLVVAIDLLGIGDEHADLVGEYFYIRIWAAPATLLLYVLLGWFFGMQNATIPMYLTILINIVNIVLSYYFVYYLDLGIKGVAIGTVIAQYVGVILGITLLIKNYHTKLLKIKKDIYQSLDQWLVFFRINFDLFIRTICLTFAFGYFYRISIDHGPIVLAANVILLQLLSWLSYSIDGFAFASESIIGKYYGQKNLEMLLKGIRYSILWGAILSVIYTLMYFFFLKNILLLFTDQEEVIIYALNIRYLIALMPLLCFSCYIWDGVYIGLTLSKYMRDSMIISLFFYIISYQFCTYKWENGIWLSFILFLTLRGIIQLYLWKSTILNKITYNLAKN